MRKRWSEVTRFLSPAVGKLLGERVVPLGLRLRTKGLVEATRRTVRTSAAVRELKGTET